MGKNFFHGAKRKPVCYQTVSSRVAIPPSLAEIAALDAQLALALECVLAEEAKRAEAKKKEKKPDRKSGSDGSQRSAK